MKRLLIVTKNFPPSDSVGTQRILKICKFLDGSKWKTYILTLKNYYKKQKSNETNVLLDRSDKLIIFRTRKLDILSLLGKVKNGVISLKRSDTRNLGDYKNSNDFEKMSRVSSLAFINNELLNGFRGFCSDLLSFPDEDVTWIPFAVVKGFLIIKKNKIDIIFSSSPRHSVHITTSILKLLTKRKLVIEFRDRGARSPWRDEARAANAFERFKHKIIKIFEKWVVQTADKVILLTPEMKADYVKNYSYLSAKKFKLFYNGFDPKNLRLSINGNIQNQRKNNAKVKFFHVGSLYKRRDPSSLIIAVYKLKVKKVLDFDDLEIKFIGRISENLNPMVDMVNRLELRNIIKFIPPVSLEESFKYMRKSDVLILLQPFTKLQIPAKFYDYICFEKPIFALGEKNGAVENIVRDRFGIFVDYHDIDAIQHGIKYFLNNPGLYSKKIRKNREFLDMSKSIKVFDDILNM